jgi:hypothetical protein
MNKKYRHAERQRSICHSPVKPQNRLQRTKNIVMLSASEAPVALLLSPQAGRSEQKCRHAER